MTCARLYKGLLQAAANTKECERDNIGTFQGNVPLLADSWEGNGSFIGDV